MPKVTKREAARRDLVEHFVYLAENAGLDVAERFLAHAEASFGNLAGQPMIGAPLKLRHPDLAGIRKWRARDFVALDLAQVLPWRGTGAGLETAPASPMS